MSMAGEFIHYNGYWHHRKLITPAQCRAARAVLKLGLRELAKLAGTTTKTLLKYEKHEKPVYPLIIEAVRKVFESRGVEFSETDTGHLIVRLPISE